MSIEQGARLYTPAELAPTLGERMTKGLKLAGLSRSAIAEYLDVGQSTVTSWTSDRITPGKQTLRLWALRTGVPFEWLETGEFLHPIDPDGGISESRLGESNPRPFHYKSGSWGRCSNVTSINAARGKRRSNGSPDEKAA